MSKQSKPKNVGVINSYTVERKVVIHRVVAPERKNIMRWMKLVFMVAILACSFAIGAAQAASNLAGPIALASVGPNGHLAMSNGVQNCVWNPSYYRYEITLWNENYYFTKYVTIVTPINDGLIASVSSVENKLLITLTNLSGNKVQGWFQFATFEMYPAPQ